MRVRFEEEEYFVMAVFEKDTRTGTMEEIRRVLPFIRKDGEMLALVNSTLKKWSSSRIRSSPGWIWKPMRRNRRRKRDGDQPICPVPTEEYPGKPDDPLPLL